MASAAILVERAARDGFARTTRARVGQKALATPAVLEVDAPFAPAGTSPRPRLVAEGGQTGGGVNFAWGPSTLFPGHKPPSHSDVVMPRLVPRGDTGAPLLGPDELMWQEGPVAGPPPSPQGAPHLT